MRLLIKLIFCLFFSALLSPLLRAEASYHPQSDSLSSIEEEAIRIIDKYEALLQNLFNFHKNEEKTKWINELRTTKVFGNTPLFKNNAKLSSPNNICKIDYDCKPSEENKYQYAPAGDFLKNYFLSNSKSNKFQYSPKIRNTCLLSFDESEMIAEVYFESQAELSPKRCIKPNDYYKRIAKIKFLKTGSDYQATHITSIRFATSPRPCLIEDENNTQPIVSSGNFAKPPGFEKAPQIIFLNPQQAESREDSAFTVQAEIKNVSRKDKIILQLNEKEITSFKYKRNILTANINLTEGKNVISIFATNSTCTISLKSAVVNLVSPPEVEITTPGNLARFTEREITIEADLRGVDNKENLSLSINSVNIALDSFRIEKNSYSNKLIGKVNLQNGSNIIDIVAMNQNSTANDNIRVTRVTQPVSIQFIHPKDYFRTADSTVHVKALITGVDDENDIRVNLGRGDSVDFQYDPGSGLLTTPQIYLNTRTIGDNTTVIISAKNEEERIRIRFKDIERTLKDTIRILQKDLTYADSNLNNLNNKFKAYRKEIEVALSDEVKSKNQLRKLNNEKAKQIRKLNAELIPLREQNQKFRKFVHDSTLFLGINYAIAPIPYSVPSLSRLNRDPLQQAYYKSLQLKNYGFSAYYIVGFWISNINRIENAVPDRNVRLSPTDIGFITNRLDGSGENYRFNYTNSKANISSFNVGVYVYSFFKPAPIYFMIGISRLKGSIWDLYSGDLRGLAPTNENGLYVTNYEELNEQGLLFGAAYVQKFFQVEAGYSVLYDDYFLNAGLNFPIKNVKIFRKKKWGPRKKKN